MRECEFRKIIVFLTVKNKVPYYTSILLISFLALIGCQSLITEIDPSRLPQGDSKLVVTCFISPQDTILSAKVTESKSVLDTGSIRADITNAIVRLSDGNRTITLPYDAKLNYYRALPTALRIEAGKTYKLTVSTPDGRQVESSTTMPEAIAIKEVKADSALAVRTRRLTEVREVTQVNLKIIWQDKAGQINYYRGFALIEGILVDKQNSSEKRVDGVDFNTIDDTNSDGQLLSLQTSYQIRNNEFRANKLRVGLFHADIHYFNYHEALRKQRSNRNPFAEPVLMYSNIKGGFGCFGAYNASWLEVKL